MVLSMVALRMTALSYVDMLSGMVAKGRARRGLNERVASNDMMI
jgi:hypothetical protein